MEIRLRQIEEEDLPQLRDWRNDPDLLAVVREYRLLNMVNQREWFHHISTSRDVEMFGIEIKDKMYWKLVGVCGLCYINWVNSSAEVSIYIGNKSICSQEVGTVVLRLLERKAFDEFNLHRLWAEPYEFHKLNIALLEKHGYKFEGRLTDHVFAKGRYWDSLIYGLVRNE